MSNIGSLSQDLKYWGDIHYHCRMMPGEFLIVKTVFAISEKAV
jgi:hypothetical protein